MDDGAICSELFLSKFALCGWSTYTQLSLQITPNSKSNILTPTNPPPTANPYAYTPTVAPLKPVSPAKRTLEFLLQMSEVLGLLWQVRAFFHLFSIWW